MALSLLFSRNRLGTFGISYELVDYGTPIPVTGEDPNAPVAGELAIQEHVIGATFATGLAGGVSGGITYKVFMRVSSGSSGSCADTPGGTTQLVDLGLQYRPRWSRSVAVGGALMNAGLPLQVCNAPQADPTPLRGRFGGAYEVLHHFRPDTTLALWVDGQLEVGGPAGTPVVGSVGVQLSVGDAVFIRAGYRGGLGFDTGPAIGVGLKYERVSISIAKAFPTGTLDAELDPFHVSFGLRF
jgi:hypothetical protein